MVILMTAVFVFSGKPYVMNSFCFVLSLFSGLELLSAVGAKQIYLYILSALYGAAVQFMPIPFYPALTAVLIVVGIAAFLLLMAHIEALHIHKVVQILPAVLLVPLLIRSLTELRGLYGGLYLSVLAMLDATLTDIFAYCIGSAAGKHKLIPKVSPHKSVEGAIGGLLGTTILLGVAYAFTAKPLGIGIPVWIMLLIIFSGSVLGQFGDLSMSTLKRGAGIKDYGWILPGHGGVLDRIDSLLFTIPYFYLCTYLLYH